VAFFAIDGPLGSEDHRRSVIEAIARRDPGIDNGSARVSLEAAALSFAFDPRSVALAAVQADLDAKLAVLRLSLVRHERREQRPCDRGALCAHAYRRRRRRPLGLPPTLEGARP
jgi:hypothetical protein